MSSTPGSKIYNQNAKWLTFLGDSITNSDWVNSFIPKNQQIPYLVQQMIGGNCRERNLGVPGNTTTQMLNRMWDVLKVVPTVAVVYGGINDAGQSIATTTTQSNLQSIITQLQNAGCSRIILCNIHNIPGTNGTSDSFYNPYRTVIQNVATNNNIPFCDFHTVNLTNPTDYWTDIEHPVASGLQKLANQVKATLDTQGWTSVLQN